MKIKRSSIVLAAFLLAAPGQGSEQSVKIRAAHGLPYIAESGRPDLVYQDNQGRMFLSAREGTSGIGSGRITSVRGDDRGRLWIAWQTEGRTRDQVFLGKRPHGQLLKKLRLSRGIRGTHHSPHLDVDATGRPWVVWVNSQPGGHRLLVTQGTSGRQNAITPIGNPVFSPHILVDVLGRPWVFWVGRGQGPHDAVFFSRCEQGTWSEPEPLTTRPAVPHFHPNAALNDRGFPAVIWSGFDGEDYELYWTSWENGRWAETEQVTDNRDFSDAQPSLVSLQQASLVVAWTQAGPEGNRILWSQRLNNSWQPPVPLTGPGRHSRSPRLVSQADMLALSWEDGDQLSVQSLSLTAAPPPRLPEEEVALRVRASDLEQSSFIAFGDSITYGAMNGPFQGIGYPPRLHDLLGDLYFDPVVINRGMPGENTWEAVSRIGPVLTSDLALFLLLMEGTNDVSWLNYSLDTTAFNLRQILVTALDMGGFPLISTIPPRAARRWNETIIQRTEELNNKIADLAEELEIMFVDNFTAFIDFPAAAGGHEALISDDNLHPNDLGYQVMAETWYQQIRILPFPPISLQAEKIERDHSIRLTWEDDPRILPATSLVSYRVYRQRLGSSILSPIALVSAPANEFLDRNVILDYDYLYVLSSLNSGGIEGPLSDPVVSVRLAPFPPENIETEYVLNRAFLHQEHINHIRWEVNPENEGIHTIASYNIYRKIKGQNDELFELLIVVPADQHEYLDRNLEGKEAAESYFYGISAVDSEGRESDIAKD
ncbi:MAG: GDSL-type esterase/lipase family protein [Candidatus Aminicenantaceae bacterium]